MELAVPQKAVAIAGGIAIAAAGMFAVATVTPQQAEAAAYKAVPSQGASNLWNPWKAKIAKKTTLAYSVKYTKNFRLKLDTSTLKITKNGKSRVIAKNVAPVGCITNGKYIYYLQQKMSNGSNKYSENGKSRFALYRVKANGTSKKKLFSVSGYHASVLTATGSYVYLGWYKSAHTSKGNVSGYNVKTKKKFSLGKGFNAGMARIAGKRVLLEGSTSGDSAPLYSFSLKGKDKKRIAAPYVGYWKVKGSKVRYIVEKKHKGAWKNQDEIEDWYNGKIYKLYQCTNTGKQKKALSGWMDYDKAEKSLANW